MSYVDAGTGLACLFEGESCHIKIKEEPPNVSVR